MAGYLDISIKLDEDFVECLKSLKKEYGNKLTILNGLSNSQLNNTEFIDNFIDKNSTTADASIDGNANASTKDICSLMTEMRKPELKLESFNKIFYELKKKYGLEIAKDWLKNEWDGHFYNHDAYSTSFLPYCVLPNECCHFILEGKHYYISIEDMYNLLDVKEETYNDISYKRPVNLVVLDYDVVNKVKRYTKVESISTKLTDKKFIYTGLANGNGVITTEDHSLIRCDGSELKAGLVDTKLDTVISYFDDSEFTNSIYYVNEMPLNGETGWLVGMYIAEGYNAKGQCCICQSKEASPEQWDKLIMLLDKYKIPFKTYRNDMIIRLNNGDMNWNKNINSIVDGKYAFGKKFCKELTHFNDNFLKGVLAGIIDGDGTIANNSTCMIRMASRTLINQIREIGLHFGVFFGARIPYIEKQNMTSFSQRNTIYSANVNMNRHKEFFESLPSIKIKKSYTNFSYDPKYDSSGFTEIFGEVRANKSCEVEIHSDVVYDMSTESHTFICNNVLVHNCFAYDLKDLAEKGLYFIQNNFNAQPPKHLSTFTDFVGEFVSFMSNRSSGEL